MKRLARLIALAAFVSFPGASLPAYDQGGFLNFAIFNLPPEYFAGIPLEDRPALFQQKSSKPVANGLYYEQGYFYTSLESETGGKPGRLWIKLLPRDTDPPVHNPYSPLVYIHVARPVADDEFTYSTHVVMWKEKKEEANWVDVTQSTLPDSVDLTLHLPPIYKFAGADIRPEGYEDSRSRVKERLIWEDWELHRRDAYPFSDDISWEAPLDAERLAMLAFKERDEYSDHRELAELIALAAVRKDERFRPLLEMEHLRDAPVLTYAKPSSGFTRATCQNLRLAQIRRPRICITQPHLYGEHIRHEMPQSHDFKMTNHPHVAHIVESLCHTKTTRTFSAAN